MYLENLARHIDPAFHLQDARVVHKDLSKNNAEIYLFPNGDLTQSVAGRIAQRANPDSAVRKDAVVLCEAVVSLEADWADHLTAKQVRSLLETAAEFLRERYREANCMYACIHMDEDAPHLHFGFVPMTEENRLSAKLMINRIELQRLQTELPASLRSQGYQIKRGKNPAFSEPAAPSASDAGPQTSQEAGSRFPDHYPDLNSLKNQKPGDLCRENQNLKLENLLLERQLKSMVETIKSDPQLELLYIRQVELQARLKRDLHQMHSSLPNG
jgi:hypothetical protein